MLQQHLTQQLKFIIQFYKTTKMKTFSKTVELTKAQIDGLNDGSPVVLDLLPAGLPAGKAFVVTSAQMWKTAGNAATGGTGDINISYGTATTAIATFNQVDAAAGALGNNAQYRIQNASLNDTNAVVADGTSLNISASAAIVCAASTTAKIKVDCQVIDL